MSQTLSALVTAALLASGALVAQAQQPARRVGVAHRDRFDGWVMLGPTDSVRVSVRTWALPGDTTLARLDLPTRGIVVGQVRAGRLITIIGGKRQPRSEGEFLTVPEGADLGLVTADDEAVLETVLIEHP